MNLKTRIHALMQPWADAGDDVPEELKVIRELMQVIEKVKDDYNGLTRVCRHYSLHATYKDAMETLKYLEEL